MYELTLLPDLPGGIDFSRAYGLNDLGQVIGDSETAGGQRAFIWDSTNGMVDLGVLANVSNANFSVASKITNDGVIVGESGRTPDIGWDRRVFTWKASNGMIDVGLGHPVSARDINEQGIIAGSFANIPVVGSPATSWQTIGPTPSGNDYRYSWGINNFNQVVGIDVVGNVGHDLSSAFLRAFHWSESTGLQYLPSLLGGSSDAHAWMINDAGQIVGLAESSSGRTAVMWDSTLSILNLGDLPGGIEDAVAHDINEVGQIVGFGANASGYRATFWDGQSGPVDLNNQLLNPLPGYVLTDARGINSHGQIVGFGTLNDAITRGFLLTPISDPLASTIDVRLDDFGPSGVMGYSFNGSETIYGSAGQFRFDTQNPVGNAAESVSPNAVGFCIELSQTFTSDFITYNVGDLTLAQDPVGISGPISPEQAALIEQLWALYYDADWLGNGAFSLDDITRSMAFSAMLYEIIYDFDGVSLASMDLGSGLFQIVDGFLLDKNDPTQELPVFDVASFFLGTLSLNYTGPRPQLLAMTNAAQQDYLVMVVPEVGTFPLVSAVVVAFGGISLARRFRKEAK
jgi:probable HAF family extracellular repeat protein